MADVSWRGPAPGPGGKAGNSIQETSPPTLTSPRHPTCLLHPCLHGGGASLPLPHSQGRDRGSGERASVQCPLVNNDPIHGLGGKLGREPVELFLREGLSPWAGAGQACPQLSPPGTGSRRAPRPGLTGGQTSQDLTLRGPGPVRPLVGRGPQAPAAPLSGHKNWAPSWAKVADGRVGVPVNSGRESL